MPSRKLFTAIAAPAVLTLASVAPALGGSQAGSAAQRRPSRRAGAAPQPRLRHGRRPRLGRPQHRPASTAATATTSTRPRSSTGSPQEGQAFTEAYASVQCSPTRTALHTGQYATRPTNNVYAVGAVTGQAERPAARGDAGSAGRGRPDRHPGGLHDHRRDPAGRRLRHRLLRQVPRRRVGRRDRQQPRLRRELGREPGLERDPLLRDEQPVQRLGLAEPRPVRARTTRRSTSTRTSRRTATG